jgi:hypothetical protein
VLARRYREAIRQEEEATRQLGMLVERLDDTVRARYAKMRRLHVGWHGVAERGLGAAASDGGRPELLREGRYEDLLPAVVRLDEEIGLEIRHHRTHIVAADRAQRWMTTLLALAGLAGQVPLPSWRGASGTTRWNSRGGTQSWSTPSMGV